MIDWLNSLPNLTVTTDFCTTQDRLVCAKCKHARLVWYSHVKEETRACFELESSVRVFCCWFDAQTTFRSSKSFLILDCWFDPRRFFTSFKSSLMRLTASSNVEDSHDALSSTVDCASTSIIGSIIPPITATTNAREILRHILINYNQCNYLQIACFSLL